jgi:hypothetical protein
MKLIPTNGVHITPAEYPRGWYVARYDAQGFASAPRWFATLALAQAYAAALVDSFRREVMLFDAGGTHPDETRPPLLNGAGAEPPPGEGRDGAT